MQASLRHTLFARPALLALTWLATGCDRAGDTASAVQTTSTTAGSSASAPEWADRANGLCETALADDRHELVDHLDLKHVREHGMSVVRAGAQLDALGAPAGAEPKSYVPGRRPRRRVRRRGVQPLRHGQMIGSCWYA